jgi:hypothetical protein
LSLIYTGRSLGALGALRSQDEHELLTERANQQKTPFKLVSHACWRAAGISVFLPSDEPDPDDLPRLLELRASAEKVAEVATLVSGNALLLQDPDKTTTARDLLAMLRENPRAASDFPDLRPGRATVYRANLTRKKVAYFVEEAEAVFTSDPAAWEKGEMNRVDVDGARLFELPLNLAQIGPRATLVRRFVAEAQSGGSTPLVVDLGSQNGDLGLDARQRARIDLGTLRRLGYEIVVPFEFELGLGAATLLDLKKEFEGLSFLAEHQDEDSRPSRGHAHRLGGRRPLRPHRAGGSRGQGLPAAARAQRLDLRGPGGGGRERDQIAASFRRGRGLCPLQSLSPAQRGPIKASRGHRCRHRRSA